MKVLFEVVTKSLEMESVYCRNVILDHSGQIEPLLITGHCIVCCSACLNQKHSRMAFSCSVTCFANYSKIIWLLLELISLAEHKQASTLCLKCKLHYYLQTANQFKCNIESQHNAVSYDYTYLSRVLHCNNHFSSSTGHQIHCPSHAFHHLTLKGTKKMLQEMSNTHMYFKIHCYVTNTEYFRLYETNENIKQLK